MSDFDYIAAIHEDIKNKLREAKQQLAKCEVQLANNKEELIDLLRNISYNTKCSCQLLQKTVCFYCRASKRLVSLLEGHELKPRAKPQLSSEERHIALNAELRRRGVRGPTDWRKLEDED